MGSLSKVAIDDWLSAQVHRDDEVGILARRWVVLSAASHDLTVERWLQDLHESQTKDSAITQLKQEYEQTVICLEAGVSSPTFPRLFACSWYQDVMESSFKKHETVRDISADEYLRTKHIELYEELKKPVLVYLDTNHWIQLRHVVLGSKHAQGSYENILNLLRDLVRIRKVLCPVSFPLFMEMMKQTDRRTRLATALLMDELSTGVCIQFPKQVERLEIRRQFLRSVLGGNMEDPLKWIWTKVGYIAGVRIPVHAGFGQLDRNLLQKVSIDGMWSMPLELFAETDPGEMPDYFGKS